MHARLERSASYAVSVRSLAGLGVKMASDECLLAYRASSQASFPRSVTLPQLPSPRVCFLRTIHLVYWLLQEMSELNTGDLAYSSYAAPHKLTPMLGVHERELRVARFQMDSHLAATA